MSRYPYQPLPNADTYLRRLHLAPGEKDSILKGWLDIVEISSTPQYDALSYYWGPNKKPRKILLQSGGKEYIMPITETLDMALKHMRHSSHERVVWTDAICIDQEMEDEKSHQVRIMDTVYAAASLVVVHLGKPAEDHEKAIELLKSIHRAANHQANNQLQGLEWLRASELPNMMEPGRWEPLKAFFRLNWFRRKWTIQESALASKLEFHYGTWSCDWPWMRTVLDSIYDRGLAVTDYTTCYSIQEAQELQQGISQINSIRLYKRDKEAGVISYFLEIVHRFQTAEAGDMRDQLYAMLGMAAADTQNTQLMPQYGTLTMIQLCLRYAYFFLQRDQTLEVLYRAGLMADQQHGPSWIPNWYGCHQTFGFEPGCGFWNPRSRPSHLNVSRGTRMVLTTPVGSIVLGLRGMIIDTIEEVATGPMSTVDDFRNKSSVLGAQLQHLNETDAIVAKLTSYPTGEALEDVKWRTLMCNTTEQGVIPDESFATSYQAWRQVTRFESPLDQLHANFVAQRPFNCVVGAWNSATVFGRTCDGYVGMFPYLARPGDEIAVMLGGEFPFVIRPCDRKYRGEHELVGQCYYHGIMEKNQFDMEKWKPKEKEILLGGFREPRSQA